MTSKSLWVSDTCYFFSSLFNRLMNRGKCFIGHKAPDNSSLQLEQFLVRDGFSSFYDFTYTPSNMNVSHWHSQFCWKRLTRS